MRILFLLLISIFLLGCTTQDELEYITANGERKVACQTEYSGAPAVDKYAVEYVLSYCARKAVKQGHSVVNEALLELDLTIPKNPEGKAWTFEYATELHNKNKLSDKQYGYVIAFIDLGLNTPNK